MGDIFRPRDWDRSPEDILNEFLMPFPSLVGNDVSSMTFDYLGWNVEIFEMKKEGQDSLSYFCSSISKNDVMVISQPFNGLPNIIDDIENFVLDTEGIDIEAIDCALLFSLKDIVEDFLDIELEF